MSSSEAWMSVRRRFPAEPETVRRARRLAAVLLEDSEYGDAVDIVTLLVSETVTNAVLHAGTEIDVYCEARSDAIRVEVSDRFPVVPAVRHYDAEAITGRGLSMVDVLAAAWGVDHDAGGKTVWFEVAAPAAGPEAADDEGFNRDATFLVRFRDLPVVLTEMALQHGDAVLRELALLSIDEWSERGLPPWRGPRLDLTGLLTPVGEALRVGVELLDIDVTFVEGAEVRADERRELIQCADGLARDGTLFTEPASPSLRRCSQWILEEICRQHDGRRARPWRQQLIAPDDSTSSPRP